MNLAVIYHVSLGICRVVTVVAMQGLFQPVSVRVRLVLPSELRHIFVDFLRTWLFANDFVRLLCSLLGAHGCCLSDGILCVERELMVVFARKLRFRLKLPRFCEFHFFLHELRGS